MLSSYEAVHLTNLHAFVYPCFICVHMADPLWWCGSASQSSIEL